MVHHVRGRLRVKDARLKRNEQQARMVEKLLLQQSGIRSAEVNVLTGSLLVYYDPEVLSVSDVLDALCITTQIAPAPRQKIIKHKVADALLWWAVEKAVERSIPLLVAALL